MERDLDLILAERYANRLEKSLRQMVRIVRKSDFLTLCDCRQLEKAEDLLHELEE